MRLSHSVRFVFSVCATAVVLLLVSGGSLTAAPPKADAGHRPVSQALDYNTYIDANEILMFVTNVGGYGRDEADRFGYDYGTFYPYSGINYIESGVSITSPLYAAGLWLGGKVNGETRIAIAEYDHEYWPGPMSGETYDPQGDTDPDYRVYKLYRDSLSTNPNQDYLDWPVDQGAPVNQLGMPDMKGDQMLWCVYSDANPNRHQNDAGQTDPLGIEVRQRVWASDVYTRKSVPVEVYSDGNSKVEVTVKIVDPMATIRTQYRLDVVNDNPGRTLAWRLYRQDASNWVAVTSESTNFGGSANPVFVDGLKIEVYNPRPEPARFEVVANASGPLTPPAGGAFDFNSFPSTRPDSTQQVGAGVWGFHTADNGGTCDGGTRTLYDSFFDRVTRDGGNNNTISMYDYEMRFTGSNANPGVNGSYAIEMYNDYNVVWVPFEIWRIGAGTPDDPSDDLRLVPYIIDDGNDNTFGLESWGCAANINHGGDGEHSCSGLDNDPFTDWVYWRVPVDTTPGQAGYLTAEAAMLDGTFPEEVYSFVSEEVFARTVLVNLDGHVMVNDTLTNPPVFTQDCPEQGTIFRVSNMIGAGTGSFHWLTESNPEPGETRSIFVEYQLHNRGGNQIDSLYLSYWFDSDVGLGTDDKVGCLSTSNMWYFYNGSNYDQRYGIAPPAFGARLVHGPLVPSPGDSAYFAGYWIPGYRNLDMTSFAYYINGTDPHAFDATFHCMTGKLGTGADYIDPVTHLADKFMLDGNPVDGTGDIDPAADDKRCLASTGPINMAPGDSQYVLIQLSVAKGENNMNSLNRLFGTLRGEDATPRCCSGVRGNVDDDPADEVTLGDLTALIDCLFISLRNPTCFNEADLFADGKIDLGDLTALVSYLFITLGPLPACP